MSDRPDAPALTRLLMGWLGCTAGVAARALPVGDIADIELVMTGGRLAYLDVCPAEGAPDTPQTILRRQRRDLGVPFLPVRSLLDARYVLEDCGVLDRRGA